MLKYDVLILLDIFCTSSFTAAPRLSQTLGAEVSRNTHADSHAGMLLTWVPPQPPSPFPGQGTHHWVLGDQNPSPPAAVPGGDMVPVSHRLCPALPGELKPALSPA